MFFTNNATSMSSSSNTTNKLTKSKSQQTVLFDVFKDHWKQVVHIFNKSLVNDDDIQIVKCNLSQMILLLIDELNQITNADFKTNKQVNYTDNVEVSSKFSGQLWDYLLAANIFETVYLWSLSYPEYLYDLKYEQLRNFEELIAQMQTNEQTNLLLYKQLHRPLFSLLNHCSTHNSEIIERYMISILNQLCVCMCKNANLLNIFFDCSSGSNGSSTMTGSPSAMFLNESSNELILERSASQNEKFYRASNQSKSFIFTLLIPYIHKEGSLGANCGSLTFGQQARDALLMIMQLSSRNSNLAKYVVYNTDFCPILATGLSGLYSELPQKLTQHENFEEIRYLQKEDILNIQSLNKFINSLEFCNNVIQVSHSLIANQLLQYVYYGFLVPVIAPALTQDVDKFPVELFQLENYTNCMDEIVSATLYLDLFLRTINEPNLLKIFLKFILFSKFDERLTLLDTLISRINSSTKMSLATLMLFHTMIDLNSEDVIYKLILTYIIPCKHLMKSQLVTLKQSSYEINGFNAQTFLSLSTNFINNPENSNNNESIPSSSNLVINNYTSLNENSPVYRWLNTYFESNELGTILSFLEQMRFNYTDYLKDAKSGILNTAEKTSKWSFRYDVVSGSNTSTNLNELKPKNLEGNTYSRSVSSKNSLSNNQTNNNHPNHHHHHHHQPQQHQHPSNELDIDADDFFFNLNISTTTFNDPSKSARSTMNLFAKEPNGGSNYESDSMIDFDETSINSEKASRTIAGGKKSTKKSEKTAIESNTKKSRSRRKKNRALANNDFYILSFDNEISETSSSSSSSPSSSSSTCSLDKLDQKKSPKPEVYEDEDENDESLTETSISSVTINNETQILEEPIPDRQNLVDYLFSNEDNNKLYLNSNLGNFLSGLDNYFAQPFDHEKKSIQKGDYKKKDLNQLCNEIATIYEELLAFDASSTNKTNYCESKKLECEVVTNNCNSDQNNLTQFPTFVATNSTNLTTDSLQTSTHSLNTTSQAADSGVEMSSSSCREDEIGPFLCALLNRLDHMLNNSLQINFLITGIFARLAFYPQLLLRSFLLNSNLVLQPNIKSLIQPFLKAVYYCSKKVMGNVKYKIDACSKTYNNFSLLYLKAKMCLVKRLVENSRPKPIHVPRSLDQTNHPNNSPQNQANTTPNSKKKFSVDRFLSIFFKSDKETTTPQLPIYSPSTQDHSGNSQYYNQREHKFISERLNTPNTTPKTTPNRSINNGNLLELTTPVVELDLNDVKMKFTKPSDSFQLQDVNLTDFSITDNEWEDIRTRNIAFSAVIFDEFVKELAAICQEHSVLTQELLI